MKTKLLSLGLMFSLGGCASNFTPEQNHAFSMALWHMGQQAADKTPDWKVETRTPSRECIPQTDFNGRFIGCFPQ